MASPDSTLARIQQGFLVFWRFPPLVRDQSLRRGHADSCSCSAAHFFLNPYSRLFLAHESDSVQTVTPARAYLQLLTAPQL
jgi:hypothetical protein